MSVLQHLRPVELSHVLVPGEEEYKLEVENRFVEDLLPDYVGLRPATADYIISEVSMWSHVGTHLEAPYHYFRDREDVSRVRLESVVGECTLLQFTDRGPGEAVTADDLAERGGDVRRGDIVFVRTDQGHYRTPQSHDRPYFTEEAIGWLVEKGISCLGVDCSGIEARGTPGQPNHVRLFEHGIPLIEHLTGLDRLASTRFFVVAVPWRVRGLDASPVAVVAFEDVGATA
jgi:arylformamidase